MPINLYVTRVIISIQAALYKFSACAKFAICAKLNKTYQPICHPQYYDIISEQNQGEICLFIISYREFLKNAENIQEK